MGSVNKLKRAFIKADMNVSMKEKSLKKVESRLSELLISEKKKNVSKKKLDKVKDKLAFKKIKVQKAKKKAMKVRTTYLNAVQKRHRNLVIS